MMKRRIFAALLAGAMALSLAACGGNNDNSSSPSSDPGSASSASSSQADSSAGGSSSSADTSGPDASVPDASDPSGSGASSSSAGDSSEPSSDVTITLNKTQISLNKAGASFRLRYTSTPDTDGIPTFTSSDTKVATVDDSGNVKAVAPGKATITVKYDGATATCAVTCDWKDKDEDTSTPTAPTAPTAPVIPPDTTLPSSGGSRPVGTVPTTPTTPTTSSSKVDLSSFYSDTTGKYEFGMLSLADKDILDAYYAGLSGISTEQTQVYYCPISMNNGEFGLVQVKDSKDVDAVKKIFQERISYMVGDGNGPGGAQYPMAMDSWENNSRVVSNGNYVMMIVHENADDIVKEFNALFK